MTFDDLMSKLGFAADTVAGVMGDDGRDGLLAECDPVSLILAIGKASACATLCGMLLAELGTALSAFTDAAVEGVLEA